MLFVAGAATENSKSPAQVDKEVLGFGPAGAEILKGQRIAQ